MIARELLDHNFNDHWIGRVGPVNWPARLPDLSSPDFFLTTNFEYLRKRGYFFANVLPNRMHKFAVGQIGKIRISSIQRHLSSITNLKK